ncbi:FAD synthase [Candidatus Thorarchaeota archaeon]|nr:MAG: FAD synthase [Candidatus Thorarchaeota archaeon]
MSGNRVLAAGKFDILHLGHIAYLEQAKELAGEGGYLIVVVALDRTIKRERGAQPVFPQEQRRRIVQALDVVNEAVLGYDTDDHTKIVRKLKPDIVALGYDQRTDIDALQRLFDRENLNTRIVRLEKRDADGLCSSTQIRKRILQYYSENGRARPGC